MEETGWSSGSFPAGDGGIWAPVLCDPLDGGSSCTAPQTQMEGEFYSAHGDDAIEIQQILQGPRDEHDLDEWLEEPMYEVLLGGAFSHAYTKEANFTHEIQCEIDSRTRDDDMTIQAPVDCKVNLLDCIPKIDWRRTPRGVRKRRIFSPERAKQTLLSCHLFGNPQGTENMPFASKGRKRGVRRNNEHWTTEEVAELVEGVSTYGVGRWTELKKDFFSTSVRTAVHLKDKWRNLLKTFTARFTSENKGKRKKTRLLPLDRKLIARIRRLADDHPCQKQSRT